MRPLALALALLAPASALAGDGYLAGGLAVSPTGPAQLASGLASWRVGYRTHRVTAWGNADYGSFSLPDEKVSGWALVPRLGVRAELSQREVGGATPYLVGSVYTRIAALDSGPTTLPADEVGHAQLDLGATAGFGLAAELTPHLSLSAEAGFDAFDASYVDDAAFVSRTLVLGTFAACYVDLWL